MATSALLQSHDELRAILKLTQRELKKPTAEDRSNSLLEKIQQVLTEAKGIAEEERKDKSHQGSGKAEGLKFCQSTLPGTGEEEADVPFISGKPERARPAARIRLPKSRKHETLMM
jgi:hypothetical protein